MQIDSRRTGRTTRMLEDAKANSDKGHPVRIVVASQREQKRIKELLKDYADIEVSTNYDPDFNSELERRTLEEEECDA